MLFKRFQKLVRNDFILNVFAKIYHVIIGALSSALLARYYGVVLKGDYAYIKEIVSIIAILCNIGINQSYSYFYRKHNGNIYKRFINLFTFQFVLNLLIFGIIAVINNDNLYMYVALMAPFTIINQNFQSCMAVENIRLKIILAAVMSLVNFISYLIIFLFAPRTLWIPILVMIANEVISIVVFTINMKFVPKPITSFSLIKEVVEYSWVPMLTSLLLTLNYSVDVIFLKHMGTGVQLGLYSTAAALISYFWLIPDAFKEVLISRVARNDSIRTVLQSIKVSLLCMIVLGFGFALIGKVFIKLLYGPEYVDSYPVVLVLLLGAISMVFFKMIGTLFMAEGRRFFYFVTLLSSGIINIIMNYVLIPSMGMYGAALASVLSYTICGITFLIYFIKVKNLSYHEIKLKKSDFLEYWIYFNDLFKVKRKVVR